MIITAGKFEKMSSKSGIKFIGTALGIFICYFYYGILQEAITKGKYIKEDGTSEPYVYTLALVSIQCFVNYFYAIILLNTWQRVKASDVQVNNKLYASCSLTYLLAMVTSNLALQWVPYPTQVIGKSCKPIPVMLLGVLIGGRSYKLRKYMFILLIVLGVILFIYKPSSSTSSNSDNNMTGNLLLLMSLSMDGLTGAIQEHMRTSGSKPNSAMMMKMINLFSIFYTFIALILTSEIFTFIQFCSRHPEILWKITTFSIASALGQFFIFVMVSEFGPLPCSVVTTTRKFFTVLASVIFFNNHITNIQWIGTAFVFIGITLDSVF